MPVSIGDRFGVYEVLSPIGSGGMGEVYRARDTRLNREVAVKVLPPLLAADRDRRARFEREAQALAALNHPNIAHIYGIVDAPAAGGSQPVPALVMELVSGEDLAQRIARGPIPIDESIRIALQISDALDAAHERGIVHRDLKPANIRLAEGGTVKVLDFGLAKAIDASGSAETAETVTSPDVTEDGVILGTAPYMSPEQARGQSVDRRTDIWAFGCVLYEMLTGRRSFRGQTTSDVNAAILTSEPDWSALPAATPPDIRRVLRRVLQKDPKRRARDIADVRFALEESADGTNLPASTAPSGVSRTWLPIAIVSTAVAVALAGWLAFGTRKPATPSPAPGGRAIVTQLTGDAGSAQDGAIAPDGGSFIYVSTDAGQRDIFLRQTEGGDPVRLTNDSAVEANPVFAPPNGDTVYYARQDAGQSAIWRIGRLGGNARKVIDDASAPAVSWDGRQLAWLAWESAGAYSLVVAATDGSNPRPLVRNLRMQDAAAPAWSADGRFLAYSTGTLFQPRNLFVVAVADGTVRQVTHFENSGEGPLTQSWLPDGRHLLVSYWAQSRAQLVNDLGILDVESGDISRLTMNVADSFTTQSLSLDGTRMIATVVRREREVWKIPDGPDPLLNGRRAELLLGAAVDPMWTYVSRDGGLLLYNNAVVGSRNLWLLPFDRSRTARQITSVPGDKLMHSSLSPDGRRVAFISSANGHADVWVQNVDGSSLRPLTNDAVADAWPVWSPDGQSIMYAADRQTMVVPVAGGEPRKVIDGFFRGDWIARPDGKGTLAVSVVPGTGTAGNAFRLIDVENRRELWTEPDATGVAMPMFNRDGTAISVQFRDGADRDGIAVYDTATRQRRVAARFPETFQFFFRASWVDNDHAFVVNRYRTRSHIVMFDGFLPKP